MNAKLTAYSIVIKIIVPITNNLKCKLCKTNTFYEPLSSKCNLYVSTQITFLLEIHFPQKRENSL